MRKILRKPLPFDIDRTSCASLVDQVTNGLRQAIEVGYYQPGDRLPTIYDICEALGVCIRAPQQAFKILASEGRISTNRKIGSVVLSKDVKVWKGHVVLFQPDFHPVYHKTVIEMRVTERLIAAGYLVTRLMLPRQIGGRFDFAQISSVLRQPVSLVLMLGDHEAASHFLSKQGAPFALVSESCCELKGCVGHVFYDRRAVLPKFLDWCRRTGVRRVEQIGTRTDSLLDMSLFAKSGIRVRNRVLPGYKRSYEVGVEGIMSASWHMFDSDFERSSLPDVYFFTDDYLTRAAVPALLKCGVCIPDDVKIVTWANVGNRQPFGVPVVNMAMDPFDDAEKVYEAVVSYFESGIFPRTVSISPSFMEV